MDYMMKALVLILSIIVIAGCASTTSKIENTPIKTLSKPQNKVSISLDGMTELVTPTNSELLVLRVNNGKYWKEVSPTKSEGRFYIHPGEYKYEIKIDGSYHTFKQELKIGDGEDKAFLHSATSPDRKFLYVWPSKVNKDTPEYRNEMLLSFCTSNVTKGTYYSVADYPDYSIDACKVLSESGTAEALSQMGYFYSNGINVDKDINKAVELLKQAYSKGNDLAGIELANIYSKRFGENDEEVAILESLSERGH